MKKLPGLAKILYAEISGQAGSKVYTRFNAALAAAGAAVVAARTVSSKSGGASSSGNIESSGSSRSGRGGGRGGATRGRGYGRPADGGKCWNCFEPGHFSSKCPKPRNNSKSNE